MDQGKKILITGATGMTGSLILHEALPKAEIAEVIVLTRRSTGIDHPKLKEIIHEDFMEYDGLEEALSDVDAAFLCLGVYTGAVPRDIFRIITVDYTRALGEKLAKCSPAATVCYLSGAGADPSEKSRMMFARDKGAAETALQACGFSATFMFRPGYIYPVESRKEPNMGYRIMRFLYPLLAPLLRSTSIRSEQLAQAMLIAGLEGAPLAVLENNDIRRLIE